MKYGLAWVHDGVLNELCISRVTKTSFVALESISVIEVVLSAGCEMATLYGVDIKLVKKPTKQ
jgi:hypothetical protein